MTRSRQRQSAVAAACLALVAAFAVALATLAGSLPPGVYVEAAAPVAPALPAPVSHRVDGARVHANELGRIPILMYHDVVPVPKKPLDVSIAAFRAEISGLYHSGYRTITLADLVRGRIDVPAGTSPMVITFDDSTPSQYRQLANGRVDPRTAVATLVELGHRNGEKRPVATMFVNARPFGNHPEYLPRLVDLGFELGDHTAAHANLRRLSAIEVQRQLVLGQEVIRRAVPGYQVTTMALPYGFHPKNRQLDRHGGFAKTSYTFDGVVLTGSNPSSSPYTRSFTPLELPRIVPGAGLFHANYWQVRLRSNRFVSDGDPTTISFPRRLRASLDPRFADRAQPY